LNLTVDVKENEKETTLFLKGEIDIYTVGLIKKELLPLTKVNGQTIVINFKDVNYMDSTGLGVFISALKSTKEYGSELKIINLQDRVLRLFKITGLDEIMNLKAAIRGVSE